MPFRRVGWALQCAAGTSPLPPSQAALGGQIWGTDPVSPKGSREVKANVGCTNSKGAASRVPSPREIFRAPLKWRCPDPWMRGSHQRPPGMSMSGFSRLCGMRGQSGELRKPAGAGVGVKPNTPKATDYQQPGTTQEALGDPLLQTLQTDSTTVEGKKFDRVYSYVTTAMRCSHREGTCYDCPHLYFITKFTFYSTFWTNFLPFHC